MPRGRGETSENRFPTSPTDRALGEEAFVADKEYQEVQASTKQVQGVVDAAAEEIEILRHQLMLHPDDKKLISELAEAQAVHTVYQQGLADLLERERTLVARDEDIAETRSLIEHRTSPGGKA